MFDELQKYKLADHFFFQSSDMLKDVCNAPTDKSGVYIIYELKKGRIELVYIGSTGKKEKDGSISTNGAGLGGLKEMIVNGQQSRKTPRQISWANKMIREGTDALDIYWYVTHDSEISDCPKIIEKIVLKRYVEIYGEPPRWN